MQEEITYQVLFFIKLIFSLEALIDIQAKKMQVN